MRFDLKRDDGKVATWEGDTPEDAAVRYVDARRVAGETVAVVATRPAKADRYGVFVLGHHGRIIG